jgi:hypothetical protein
MKTLKALLVTIVLAVLIFPLTVISATYFDLPGIKDYKYLENEKFPWDPPYIPEMLTWQMYANRRSNGWWLNVWHNFMNHEGNLRHQYYRVTARAYYDDYRQRIPQADASAETIPEGTPAMKEFMWWTYPPQLATMAYLNWDYYDTPRVRKDVDRWLYSPTMRRTRRMGGGDRSDCIGGGDFTYDDILGREVFEFDGTFIGVDYLYLDDLVWDTGFYDHARKFEKELTMGEKMPWMEEKGHTKLTYMATEILPSTVPTEDKPLTCVVVESIPKVDNYYLSKIVTWYLLPDDKRTAIDVREEHYDLKGNLWRIRSRAWSFYPSPLDPNLKHLFHSLEHIWDIQIDHRTVITFSLYPIPYNLQDKYVPEAIFDPNGLPNLSDPQPGIGVISDKVYGAGLYDNFRPMIPSKHPLFVDKFPEHRKIAQHLYEQEWIKEVMARDEASKKEHPDRKKWVTWENAPEEIKRVCVNP